MKDVEYFAPKTLKEALQLEGKHGSSLKVLAGGTDLVRDMNLEFKIPQAVMWTGNLGLEYIKQVEGVIHIGSATRMQTAGASKLLQQKATALAMAAGKMASPPVRSLATLGGDLCTASPAGDTVCAMLGLGASSFWPARGRSASFPWTNSSPGLARRSWSRARSLRRSWSSPLALVKDQPTPRSGAGRR